MTKEQLLIPRYKVIARWPNMREDCFYENQIIELTEVDGQQRYAKIKEGHVYDVWFDMYPHLFERLPWYKNRRPCEMPKYVVFASSDDGIISKASDWHIGHTGIFCYIDGDLVHPGTSDLLPATESEYLAYINQQK